MIDEFSSPEEVSQYLRIIKNLKELEENQKNLDPEIKKVVDENFWDLIEESDGDKCKKKRK